MLRLLTTTSGRRSQAGSLEGEGSSGASISRGSRVPAGSVTKSRVLTSVVVSNCSLGRTARKGTWDAIRETERESACCARVWERVRVRVRVPVSRRKCKQNRKLLLGLPVSAVTLYLHFTTSYVMVCASTGVNNSLLMYSLHTSCWPMEWLPRICIHVSLSFCTNSHQDSKNCIP